MTTLEQVAEITGGGTPPRAEASYFGGGICWATPTDVTALQDLYIRDTRETLTPAGLAGSSARLLPAGAVLLTSRATIGFTAVSKVPISTNQGFVNFVCGPRIQPEYLAYWLRAKKPTLERLANGATFKEISRGTVRKLEIKVPDRAEQARVVDLLSRAENMVRMRREAEQRAKEIIPALFLDMFGDPGTNPKGWGIESLAEVAAIESPLRTPNFVTEATEVCIGPDSIESMTGQLLSQPTVGDIRPISGKYRYRCRDVLYSKIRPALVKVALAPSDGYCSADMYPLRCGPKLQPEYLMQILLNRHFTRYALDRATRAQMPKINREALFAFRLPVPSIDLQESFARHCQGYMRVREQQRTAMGTAELAFQSLLARVFGE